MKDLSHATGVSSGTIRFYIQKGILPKPLKTHQNMAYYDESYIDRIRAIKELQSKRFLPLSIIKEMMEANNFSLSIEQRQLLKEMEKPLFEDWIFNSNQDPLDKKSLSEHAGLSLEDINALERIGMISLDQNGLFDKECIQIAEILAELRKIGLTEEHDFHVEHLQIHQDLIEFMARKEVEIFTKRIDPGDLSPKEVISLAQEAVDILNMAILILHRRMVRKAIEELE